MVNMSDLDDLLRRGVADDLAPGLAAAVLKPDGETLVASAGVRGLDNPAALTPDTIFYIASCTKPVTSIAVLQLVERGLVSLDEPVGGLIPALADPEVLTGFDAAGAPITRPARSKITLRHLLTHTSGLAYDFTSVELTRYLSSKGLDFRQPEPPPIPLVFDPGGGWIYGVGIDWVGRLIEAVTGQGLEVYCAANIFEPLDMHDTTFFPSPGTKGAQGERPFPRRRREFHRRSVRDADGASLLDGGRGAERSGGGVHEVSGRLGKRRAPLAWASHVRSDDEKPGRQVRRGVDRHRGPHGQP